MSMSRLTVSLAGGIAVAGLAASLVIHQSGEARLREREEVSRQQAEQIARLLGENERLSNEIARANSPEALAPNELRELLKLRGQIGSLRQAAKEQLQLEAANRQLRATQATPDQQLAAARAAPNFWPKDQLAFAGYAEPETALKSLLWAMNNGDVKSYMACTLAGEEMSRHFESLPREKVEGELAVAGKGLSASLGPAVGFHIVDKKVKSPDEVILNLSFDGEGKARRFVMKKTDDEWKLDQMLLIGETEP